MTNRKSRTTREAQTRAGNPVHEDNMISFDDMSGIPNIKPRPGYTHRWVRMSTKGTLDRSNIYKAMVKGWQPREASTLTGAEAFLVQKIDGFQQDVIATHDLVLMERAEDLASQEAAGHKQKWQGLESAVKNDLLADTRGGESAGMKSPSLETESRVERGRPIVADD